MSMCITNLISIQKNNEVRLGNLMQKYRFKIGQKLDMLIFIKLGNLSFQVTPKTGIFSKHELNTLK